MSRIGKHPVPIPKGVTAKVEGNTVHVKGPKGELERTLHPEMKVSFKDDQITVERPSDEANHKALHGLSRTLVANMVEGVTSGFQKTLEIQGVGYRASLRGTSLELNVGFSHSVVKPPPDGIEFEVPQPTLVIVKGIDKQKVGQVAAEVRSVRPPEPYKGKGIRYQGEHVRRKVGKRA